MSEDTISRQAVIDTVHKIILGFFSDEDGAMTDTEKTILSVSKAVCNGVRELPSEQPEVLACGEGELIAQPEIVRCKDCKYWNDEFAKDKSTCWLPCMSMTTHREWYCGSAERRTDEAD